MLDITFDFRTDSHGKDPDGYSPTLNAYHKALWSKELPNSEVMDLQSGKPPYAFRWKDFWFSSDTIIVEMLHWRNKKIVDQVQELITDSEGLFEHLVSRSYSIGGTIIFPVHKNSMNQMRGMNILISDRWDLTLECIRKNYAGEESPLSKVIESDKAFYDLFVDFKGYVDFFFMQDCVSEDYSAVKIWIGDASFKKSGLPETVEEYLQYKNMDAATVAILRAGTEENALEAIKYANEALGFSGSLYQDMISTSAIMGHQSEENKKYKVTWRYHPDDGLEVTYEKK